MGLFHFSLTVEKTQIENSYYFLNFLKYGWK